MPYLSLLSKLFGYTCLREAQYSPDEWARDRWEESLDEAISMFFI
jgi:hypothetical protein